MGTPRYGTPLEERLAADVSGALRAQLRMELKRAKHGLDARLREPHAPDEYERLRILRDACDAGLRTIDTVSRRLAKRRSS